MPVVLTNALIAGFLLMAVLGTVELLVTGPEGATFQPVAAVTLGAWAVWMRRRGRPRPELLLAVGVTLAFGYLVAAAIDPASSDVTDTSPIAIIVGAGVIALAVGGRTSVAVGVYALVVTGLATVVVQMAIGTPAIQTAVDAGLPGVVVHGLLQSAWMLTAVTPESGDHPIRSARFRYRSPLRPGVTVGIVTSESDDSVEVTVTDGTTEYVTARIEPTS